VSEEQSLEALQRELLELEAALQGIHNQRAEQERAVLAALEQERDEYAREYAEKMKRQELLIKRGQADPWWWLEHFDDLGGDW
jgi:hypothetical protein